jgi:cytoskeletal protein RodZ
MSEETSIGDLLRQTREQKNKSLDAVNRDTKISLNVLHGFEAGQFDLVELVYARMTLSTYAEYLGLDAAELLQRFDREFIPAEPLPPTVQVPPPKKIKSSTSKFTIPPLLRLVALGFVGLALIFALVLYLDGDVRDTSQIRPDPRSAAQLSAPQNLTAAESPAKRSATLPPVVKPAAEASVAPSTSVAAEMPVEQSPAELSSTAEETSSTETPVAISSVPATIAEEVSPLPESSTPATTSAAGEEMPAPAIEEIASAALDTLSSAAETTVNDTLATSAPVSEAAVNEKADISSSVSEEGVNATPDTSVSTATATTSQTPDTAAPTETTPAPAADSLLHLQLTAEATDSTWVEVVRDGQIIYSGILLAGQTRQWRSGDDFLVRSGRPHGIRYSFQGQRLGDDGHLGPVDGYLRFRVSSAGVILLDADLQPLDDPAQP